MIPDVLPRNSNHDFQLVPLIAEHNDLGFVRLEIIQSCLTKISVSQVANGGNETG